VIVLVQKLNHNSHPKCKSKSRKTTRLQKSAVRARDYAVYKAACLFSLFFSLFFLFPCIPLLDE
jgi:hypothetical protein